MLPDSRPVESREPVPVLILGKGVTALSALRCVGRRGIPVYVGGEPGSLVTRSRWYRPLPLGPGVALANGNLAEVLESLPIPRMVLIPTSDMWATNVSLLPPRIAARFPSTV